MLGLKRKPENQGLELVKLPSGGSAYVRPNGDLFYCSGDSWTCFRGHGNQTHWEKCHWLGCGATRG